ncbi:MAG: hypothetical protein ORN98_06245 [Alphaproteobacteria bacterium]|nr:hypothetical protein [Alphaproteobacteria bacterium]
MTFDAFWDMMRWLLLPSIGALAWWVNANRAESERYMQSQDVLQREALARLESKTYQDSQLLSRQFASFQLEVVSNYARTEQMERALDRISDALAKIDEKIESLRSEKVGRGERGGL